jgi:hypothetical protein
MWLLTVTAPKHNKRYNIFTSPFKAQWLLYVLPNFTLKINVDFAHKVYLWVPCEFQKKTAVISQSIVSRVVSAVEA